MCPAHAKGASMDLLTLLTISLHCYVYHWLWQTELFSIDEDYTLRATDCTSLTPESHPPEEVSAWGVPPGGCLSGVSILERGEPLAGNHTCCRNVPSNRPSPCKQPPPILDDPTVGYSYRWLLRVSAHPQILASEFQMPMGVYLVLPYILCCCKAFYHHETHLL